VWSLLPAGCWLAMLPPPPCHGDITAVLKVACRWLADAGQFGRTTILRCIAAPPDAILVAGLTRTLPCGGQPVDRLGYVARNPPCGAAPAVPGYRLRVRAA